MRDLTMLESVYTGGIIIVKRITINNALNIHALVYDDLHKSDD